MLRIKILASAVPLIVAAVFARGGLLPGPRPCIAIGETSVQLAELPRQARLHVGFTSDPALATVRVQVVDSAEAADFAVVDDVDNGDAGSCQANAATQLVAISACRPTAPPITGSLCARRLSPRAMRQRWWSAPAAADTGRCRPPRSEFSLGALTLP
jgi:hypothetical protein